MNFAYRVSYPSNARKIMIMSNQLYVLDSSLNFSIYQIHPVKNNLLVEYSNFSSASIMNSSLIAGGNDDSVQIY